MTTASFDIIIIDDSFTEENEQFYLTIDPLTLSSDVMFDNFNAAVITIVDDDGELFINYYWYHGITIVPLKNNIKLTQQFCSMLTHTHTYVKYLKARYSKVNQVGS